MSTEIKSTFKVSGMDCADEIEAIEKALATNGINQISANIMSSTVTVFHNEELTREWVQRKIESTGVKVFEQDGEKISDRRNKIHTLIVLVSGLFLLGSMLIERYFPELEVLNKILVFSSILFASSLVMPKALRSIKTRSIDMNLLMIVALIGSIVIREYTEGAAVVFLFSLAELLESYSLNRARKSIGSLLSLAPETALVKRASIQEVAVSDVLLNEVIIVKSGMKIPLDGEVVKGRSSVNQAPITGESVPIERTVGDSVLAGTLNEEGVLEVKVTAIYGQTKLSQIIRLIEDAQATKAPTQRFVDRFAEIYTPIVFIFSVLICLVPPLVFQGDWNVWFYRSLVLLVVACPCALVISTPISVVSGLTAMARRGVLIKGGASLEMLGKLKALAVDKTGTITRGEPQVISVQVFKGFSQNHVLAIAAAIDNHSSHPLAKAVIEKARLEGVQIPPSEDYRSHTGRGAEALIDGHIYFVGNHKFAHDNAACSVEVETILTEIEEKAQSVVIVGHRPHADCQGQVIGILALADPVREDAKDSIVALHQAGIRNVVMLSGDNAKTVAAISKEVGIDEAYGDLLPVDKVSQMKELRRRFDHVAMIGDGVNDAPAMAAASLGIAMGATGTDTAIEASDITLMNDRLTAVAEAVKMGRRTLKIIWFNTAFAIVVKAAFLVFSVIGLSSLWMAIAADTGATLLVIANALRLLAPKVN